MKKIIKAFISAACIVPLASGCIQEIEPQSGSVTLGQAAAAPGAYDNFVDAITSSLTGAFTYGGESNKYPWDFGYPSFYLQRDVMGNDIACEDAGSEWYTTWYGCGTGLGPGYSVCQLPWTYYYKWIKNCNIVLSMYKATPDESKKVGAGIALAMRAMFFMDIARMYSEKTYAEDKSAITVPFITDETLVEDCIHNPRATNEVIFGHIIDDLNLAEEYLAGYTRADKFVPDQSVVYGLKARAYLTMEDWPNAEKYAKLAQQGYTEMTADEYTNQKTGFNTPNGSWIFGLTYKPDDKNITVNDGDSSWGSQMIVEVSESECGYSANYVGPKRIDSHLFSTIPATDFRRMCWVDPAIDALGSKEEKIAALAAYSDSPGGLYKTGYSVSARKSVGGIPVKFRPKNGEHKDQYAAYIVAVPIMRVEEMKLIEIEAAGMQDEGRGKTLLTEFAKKRDPNFEYGTHHDAYYATRANTFQQECWWQRRVEFWGEGLATFDIKRYNAGIIRSYAGTNHPEGYRWNETKNPQWMTLCFVGTESDYNLDLVQNPTPIKPTEDSKEFVW